MNKTLYMQRYSYIWSVTLICLGLWGTPAHSAPKSSKAPTMEQNLDYLVGEALSATEAYEELEFLSDQIGHRLSGTQALEDAIEWATNEMTEDGLRAYTEPVQVPVWVRGAESATLLDPIERDLPMLGLGGSVGTPEGGLTGEVVVVDSFDHLETLGEAVAGKIVLYDVPFTTYGKTVQYRLHGASKAAKHGAIASLIRSVTPTSLQSPHTGTMIYAEDAPKIPSAALTLEDASLIRRLSAHIPSLRIRLNMEAETLPDAESANVIGDLPGRSHRKEIVVIACHLDSWDAGTAAQDDGAGCTVVMEAARLIATLKKRPRRTIRVVLYTNEENGMRGAKQYVIDHESEIANHVAALESDSGAGAPLGFGVDIRHFPEESPETAALQSQVIEQLAYLDRWLAPLGAGSIEAGGSGADVGKLAERGVLGLGLRHNMDGYWPIHHTHADTMDKIDPLVLARNVAAVTVIAYWLAETPERPLPPMSPEK